MRMPTIEKAINMLEGGFSVSIEDFACILKTCRKEKSPTNVQHLYALMRERGLETHRSLGNYLVPVLVEVGRLSDAQELFNQLPHKNEYSYNSLLSGYVKSDQSHHAFTLYEKMQDDSFCCPSEHTFVPLLQACAKSKDGERGYNVHAAIVIRGLEGDFFISSTMVHMYAKCGLLIAAQLVFDGLHIRDAITWTSLIAGYVKFGYYECGLDCFEQMLQEGIPPNPLIFVCIFKSCGNLRFVEKGQLMHVNVEKMGLLKTDILVGNALIDMYAKCGILENAEDVFMKMPQKDVISWNTLVAGYLKQGLTYEVFECFEDMQIEGLPPDAVTFVCNLTACSVVGNIGKGHDLHFEIIIKGFLEGNLLIGNALVDMYASCGSLLEAEQVFDSLQARDVVAWTSLIAGYTNHGLGKEALVRFQNMQDEGTSPDNVVFICCLKACSCIGAIDKAKEIHAEVVRRKLLEEHPNMGTALIDTYSSCGVSTETHEVFERLQIRDVVSWNAIIAAFVDQGYNMPALISFEQMQLEGVYPDIVTYVCILKSCCNLGAIDKGRTMHAEIVKKNLLESHLVSGNVLVDMYASCGQFEEAQEIFDKLSVKDIVSCNTIITGYIKYGYFDHASSCICYMQQLGIMPDVVTYHCSLKVCSNVDSRVNCYTLHNELVKKGLLDKDFVINIELLPCSFLMKSQEKKSTVLWNAVMAAYANHGHAEEAFNCFECIEFEGVLDAVTFACGIKACTILGDLCKGQEIYRRVVEVGFECDILVGTALLDMYTTYGMFMEAEEVFLNLSGHDTITWNMLISGYLKHGYNDEVLATFELMKVEEAHPDCITYICSLNACSIMGIIAKGQEIHDEISKKGILRGNVIDNALINMYAKCNQLEEAREILTKVEADTVSWNALITGHVNYGSCLTALDCFEQMVSKGVCPDFVTFICSLKACGGLNSVEMGYQMHAEVVMRGFLESYLTIGNALMDMYMKCGSIAEAQDVFVKLPIQDVVSWNVLIAGNINEGYDEEALNCLQEMQLQGLSPDAVTIMSILQACGRIGALKLGKEFHSEIVKRGLLESNLVIANALVDMYVNCCLFASARSVIKHLPSRDVISWTTIISGYTKQGYSEEALSCLEQMQQEGILSDFPLCNALLAGYADLGQIGKVFYILERMGEDYLDLVVDTFVCVLTACSHLGLTNEGQVCFDIMRTGYGIIPTLEHYTCMVDLLGRAGELEKAKLIIKEMPFHPDTLICHTLLGACMKWLNVALGRQAFESALQLDGRDTAAYVCMYNIYAIHGLSQLS